MTAYSFLTCLLLKKKAYSWKTKST